MPTRRGAVLRLSDTDCREIEALLARYGLRLVLCAAGAPIPASYWGDDEAGLKGDCVFARADTPLHSILHETCHYICMDAGRRAGLDTDAGGDDAEESAVCYLQIILAAELSVCGPARMQRDMDAWGYSFRLGSARAWFERDAADAFAWLLAHGLVNTDRRPSFRLRQAR